MSNVIKSKRFVIRKSLIGKGNVIEFTDYSGKVWKYDHDKVYELNKERLESLPSCHKYKCYTQTYNMPKYIRAQAEQVLVDD